MIGVLQEDFSLTGGVEAVTRRLIEAFLRVSKNINVYSCKQSKLYKKNDYNVNVLGIKKFNDKKINEFISILNHDSVSDLIIQLNGPYSIMANKKLFKKLYSAKIKVYVVIHNSPKAFISVYNNSTESSFIYIIKKIRMFLYLKKRNKSFFKSTSKYVKYVTISQGNQNELRQYYNVESIIIPNFYDIDDTFSGCLKKTHSIAYIGRFDFCQKNIIFLLDAWNAVKNKGDWFFTILGDEDSSSKKIIQSYVESYSISNVIIDGVLSKDEVKSFLEKNSILLLGSRYEGFPTVVLEAGVKENVVISTMYDGFSDELLKHNINCFIVDEFDVKKYSDYIQELITNDYVLNNYREEMKKTVNEYLRQDIYEKWMDLING